MKITFTDGEKLGVLEDGKVSFFESGYITRYRENTLRSVKSREWKQKTDMMFADDYYFNMDEEAEVNAFVHTVSPTPEANRILYTFSVNGTSGVYSKYLDDKEKTEAHMISSNEVEFTSVFVTADGQVLATVRTDYVCSNIAVFSKEGSDYKSLTGGDSLDENPSFDREGNVLFNSYGVGRDANNNFLAYYPSEIYRLDPITLQMDILVSNERYSYIKPIMDSDGKLYCIRKPGTEKEESNAFLEILMIPVRIVQAIVGFVSAFVMCFAKKPMISGQSARSIGNGGDMAKNGNADAKKIFVNNNLINVDKELKKNKKSEEYGFIPRNWKLVCFTPNERGGFDVGTERELAGGVADFCLTEENGEKTLIYTNGKRIFKIRATNGEIKREKLLDVDFCLKVNVVYPVATSADPFDTCKDTGGLFEKI